MTESIGCCQGLLACINSIIVTTVIMITVVTTIIYITKRLSARDRCVWSKSELVRHVLSDLIGAGNRQMVNVRQDHIMVTQ